MAAGGIPSAGDVFSNLHQVEEELEKPSVEEEEEEEWDKAFSVERFGDLISENLPRDSEKIGRSYSERDFEFHRHTSHHIHHPLSTHLPPSMRFKKKIPRIERRKRKKRKKKKTSIPPSEVTPTIQEVDEEEEAESETETQEKEATTSSEPADKPKARLIFKSLIIATERMR
nr:PREDICTED: anion exchange protein 3-like [Latimeria chalumnae]|eukprot:XP_014341458.1 PREDICTED: anion exchange protein 3-like [Latimeria chalumnae]